MTPAASPLPMAAKRALRPKRGPTAAWPTSPRVMAATAGPRTELAATCSSFAATIVANTGATAIISALRPMPMTASAAARCLERAQSTSQPPGTWPSRLAMLPMERTSPISTCVHFWVVR